LPNNGFVLAQSSISTESAWQGVQALKSFQIGVSPHNQFADLNAIIGSVGSIKRFRGRLLIPGVQFPTPEQDFTATITDTGITFENVPENGWPRVSFIFVSEPQQNTFRFDECLIEPSDRSVDGAILISRLLFFLSKAYRCSLDAINLGEVFNVGLRLFSEEENSGIFEIANLARKLKYIQNAFNIEFSLPLEIYGRDFMITESIFRGITEGEFTIRAPYVEFPKVSPSDIDLTKPPFEGCGTFSGRTSEKITLFDKQILVGPVTVHLDKAELASPKVVEHIRKGLNSPIDVSFEVLDNQVTCRFESYVRKPRSQRMQRLKRFKYELAKKEPRELFDLIDESFQGNVSSKEASQIAVGWTLYQGLPDRYCPQEPELDNDTKRWRVPIYLVYANGEGGPVGELIIDLKSGKIIEHTPLEEMRSKAHCLAEKIFHAG
jgi:hypothetical protein